jgi:hypothetical protein
MACTTGTAISYWSCLISRRHLPSAAIQGRSQAISQAIISTRGLNN